MDNVLKTAGYSAAGLSISIAAVFGAVTMGANISTEIAANMAILSTLVTGAAGWAINHFVRMNSTSDEAEFISGPFALGLIMPAIILCCASVMSNFSGTADAITTSFEAIANHYAPTS